MLNRIKLFEYEFISELNVNEVICDIISHDSFEKPHHLPFLITPNVDYIVKLAKPDKSELKKILQKSLYILPDGQPIVWTSKFLGRGLKARLAGSDLFPALWNKCKETNLKVLALTSSDSISEALTNDNPLALCYSLPFFEKDDKSLLDHLTDKYVQVIVENDIKIVLLGISFPKQDILAVSIYKRLKSMKEVKLPLFCMLGASFEFYIQIKKRAPLFIQKSGFEWLHRFSQEPNRLFRRYFIESVMFINIVFNEIFNRKSLTDDKPA